MAQRLFTLPDGGHAFMSTTTMWGDLGTPAERTMTAAEAMTATGMDQMQLLEVPLYGRLEDDHISDYRMPKNKGILIKDRAHNYVKPVGVVGRNRTVTQFAELAYPMDQLVDASGGYIETFGLLEPGGQWFAMVRLPKEVTIGGDTHYPYVLGVDGLWCNYVVTPRLMRLSCTNQIPAVLMSVRNANRAGSYVMKHTSRAEVNLSAMKMAVGMTYTMAEELDTLSRIMLDQRFVDAEFKALTDDLFGVPEPDENGKVSSQARTIYRKRTNTLMDLFNGQGQTTESTWRAGYTTKWTAFQAITEYIDWKAPVTGHNRLARRLERTMDNSIQLTKSKALEALL